MAWFVNGVERVLVNPPDSSNENKFLFREPRVDTESDETRGQLPFERLNAFLSRRINLFHRLIYGLLDN